MAGGNSTSERLARLEEFVGVPLSTDDLSLANHVHDLDEGMNEIRGRLEAVSKSHDVKISDLVETMKEFMETAKVEMQKVSDEVIVLRKAAVAGSSSGREAHSKVKIPESKSYDGARVAKDLENFLWDMEQYFKAAHIIETEQVSIISMYLVGDAKLWWRTRTDGDAGGDRPVIATFDALKEQFLPLNSSWLARENLRNLKQTGTVRDYVKEFSSLLLDIKNMSEKDKLFNFLAGLKPWAQAELRRQNVKDLPTAVAAADALLDYKHIFLTILK